MSTGFNQSIILGRLSGPPERIPIKSGSVMLKATLEVTTYRRGSDGTGEEVKTRVAATLFGKAAELFESYVEPGHLVQLIGRLDGFEKKGKEGTSWLMLSFVAEQIMLLPNNRKESSDTQKRFSPAKARPEPRDWNRQPVTRPMEYDADGQPKDINF